MDELPGRTRSPAPLTTGTSQLVGNGAEEEMPRVKMTRRAVIGLVLFTVAAIGFLYFVLPRIAGLRQTWSRLADGNAWWIALAVGFEVVSFLGYVALFRTVFVRGGSRIDWRESYQITMAGLAATRLFAAAGAGGVALTAWALRRSGMERRIVACRMIAFLVLLYGVYMLALVLGGLGLWLGVLSGRAPLSLTLVPAILAACVIVIVLAMALVPSDFQRRLLDWRIGSDRVKRWAHGAATVPASMSSGVRTAISIVRSNDAGVVGAVVWWGFDIAVLWACFHAFGGSPPGGVLVLAYFIGMLGNTLPLPGGIGGVDGGMIGAFLAFGVDDGLAVVAVLVYRGIAFWLPTLPGALAYLQLRKTVKSWTAAPARVSA